MRPFPVAPPSQKYDLGGRYAIYSRMADDPKAQHKEDQLIGPSEDGQINDLLTNLSPKDGYQRLQSLIAEWLRIENFVVLTGSGTSVFTGRFGQVPKTPIYLVSGWGEYELSGAMP
jgi:hypothetical protein